MGVGATSAGGVVEQPETATNMAIPITTARTLGSFISTPWVVQIFGWYLNGKVDPFLRSKIFKKRAYLTVG